MSLTEPPEAQRFKEDFSIWYGDGSGRNK